MPFNLLSLFARLYLHLIAQFALIWPAISQALYQVGLAALVCLDCRPYRHREFLTGVCSGPKSLSHRIPDVLAMVETPSGWTWIRQVEGHCPRLIIGLSIIDFLILARINSCIRDENANQQAWSLSMPADAASIWWVMGPMDSLGRTVDRKS